MKKIIAIILVLIGAYLFMVIDSPYGYYSTYAYTSGSPGAKTGSPGDGSTCLQCHSGSLNPGSVNRSISSTSLLGGYVPGQTYTIIADVNGTSSNKIGFEVTVERDGYGSKIGTLINTQTTRTKLVNGNTAITHIAGGASATGGSNSWSFDWIAPAAGTGDVTFYGAFNVSNSNSTSSGDQIYTTNFKVAELVTAINDVEQELVEIYPNPVKDILTIKSQKNIERIEVYGLDGKLMVMSNLSTTINLNKLPPGIYLTKIFSEKNVIVKKIVKI